MSSTSDKIKGLANQAAGNLKRAAGKAVGNDKMRIDGVLQERRGEARQVSGKAKVAVKKIVRDA